MHPNCRSTTIAAFDDDNIADLTRRARDPETGKYVEVPADLSYNEWVKKNIEKNQNQSFEYSEELTPPTDGLLKKIGKEKELPIRFESEEEVIKYFENSSDKWIDSLTDQEITKIIQYSDYGYKDINEWLRNKNLPYMTDSEEMNGLISNLDSAIKKFTLENSVIAYRSVSVNYLKEVHDNLSDWKGEVYIDPGFMSSSLLKRVALNFKKKDFIIFEIEVPKGKGNAAYIRELSENEKEYELLIKRDARLKVLNVSKKDGNIVFEMRMELNDKR
jgi:hypothetical protein